MRQNNWYVITGGPSTGKTTLIDEFSRLGYSTIQEAARLVIDQALAEGVTATQLRSDEAAFQEKVAYKKQEIESRLNAQDTILLDRGMHDTEAYYDYYRFTMPEPVKELMNVRYRAVFLLQPLVVYENDYARTEDETFRVNIDRLLESTYAKYGMKPILVPPISVAGRVKLIQNCISKEATA